MLSRISLNKWLGLAGNFEYSTINRKVREGDIVPPPDHWGELEQWQKIVISRREVCGVIERKDCVILEYGREENYKIDTFPLPQWRAATTDTLIQVRERWPFTRINGGSILGFGQWGELTSDPRGYMPDNFPACALPRYSFESRYLEHWFDYNWVFPRAINGDTFTAFDNSGRAYLGKLNCEVPRCVRFVDLPVHGKLLPGQLANPITYLWRVD